MQDLDKLSFKAINKETKKEEDKELPASFFHKLFKPVSALTSKFGVRSTLFFGLKGWIFKRWKKKGMDVFFVRLRFLRVDSGGLNGGYSA